MNLYDSTKAKFQDKQRGESKRWAAALARATVTLEEAGKRFRMPAPLRVYTSVSSVTKAGEPDSRGVKFSVRFSGQEVGTLVVGKPAMPVQLLISRKQAANNQRFKVGLPPGRFPWDGEDAKALRRAFTGLDSAIDGGRSRAAANPRIPEHGFEARILEQLEATSARAKFGGSLSGVRHCGLSRHEFPLQYPVPISGSGGKPKATKGSIDILARHRRKGVTRLSVWELKRPGETAHCLEQAYIYAVTLALMLRGEGGSDWYKAYGFSGLIPKRLHIEAVAVVSRDRRGAIEKAVAGLAESPRWLEDEATQVTLHALYYEPDSLKMMWEDL